MARESHTLSEVQQYAQHATNAPGSWRLYSAPVVSGGNTKFTMAKLNPTNNEPIIVGTYIMSNAEFATLKALNPTLNLAPISAAGT